MTLIRIKMNWVDRIKLTAQWMQMTINIIETNINYIQSLKLNVHNGNRYIK